MTATSTLHSLQQADYDYIIIGGGIAGASVGYFLAPHGRVVLLERESQPGYHSTGRSAALFNESYGGDQVRILTMASRAFFENPPEDFCEHPLLERPRGVLMVASQGQEDLMRQKWLASSAINPKIVCLDAAEACAMVPVLRPEKVIGAVFDPGAADMDVHGLHQGFLRGIRQHGGGIVCDAEVTAMHYADGWQVRAGGRDFAAPVVINAAGAWADQIAALAGAQAIGLEPRRRSAFLFAPPAGVECAHWPMALGIEEDWYFKPDAGMLLASPANADLVPPQDVQPEELDIATAMYNIEEMTTLQIRPSRPWAGLRSFVTDGGLVGGFDPQASGFFWVAAQGGYGIQTAPAMGETCAALVRGQAIPAHVAAFGLTAGMLAAVRLPKAG